MTSRYQRETPADLARARDRFDEWRRTTRSRSRIPEPLWQLAVRVAATHGVSRTAQTLKLDYYSLKSRVEEAASVGDSASVSAFVELPSSLGSAKECIIELEDPLGVALRLVLKGYDAAELATVGRELRATS